MKFQYEDESTSDILQISETPRYQNHCNHKPEEFVCSFTVLNFGKKEIKHYDLYIHNADNKQEQHVCIRCSNDEADYISSTNLGLFLSTDHKYEGKVVQPYGRAKELILKLGIISFKPKETPIYS